MKPIRIGNRLVGPGHPCFIIAEMSANHNKSFKNALRIIEAAKEAGADAVKLQTYTPDTMTLDSDKKWFRIKKGLWKGYTLYDLYKQAYMPWEWQKDLKKHADKLGIMFFSTAFDTTSVDFLESLKVPVHKIASFELNHIPLLEYVSKRRKPVIISTGMAELSEIDEAVATLRKRLGNDIVLLKCTSAYPARPDEMNIRAIDTLRARYGLNIGLSDHSIEPQVALTAVACGAVLLEKHFTLKRSAGGPDAAFSIEPKELKLLVNYVRKCESILGSSKIATVHGENNNRIFKRSIFVSTSVKGGDRVSDQSVKIVRPGNGLTPASMDCIKGKVFRNAISMGTPLKMIMLRKR